MLAFADMVHLLTHKLACLRAGSLALTPVAAEVKAIPGKSEDAGDFDSNDGLVPEEATPLPEPPEISIDIVWSYLQGGTRRTSSSAWVISAAW